MTLPHSSPVVRRAIRHGPFGAIGRALLQAGALLLVVAVVTGAAWALLFAVDLLIGLVFGA
ncbi:MAG: hypothetical protein AB7O97_03260 [Planctomycetota bacterium]